MSIDVVAAGERPGGTLALTAHQLTVLIGRRLDKGRLYCIVFIEPSGSTE